MEQFRDKFIEEASDLINDLEKSLLELESNPNNPEIVQQIFRVMHSLKGGSSMFGFVKMDKFTHHLENIYDLIRNNKLTITEEIFNVIKSKYLIKSISYIKQL